MKAWLAGAALLFSGAACGDAAATDRDRDGLPDALETSLATRFLPVLHEYRGADGIDRCSWPTPRPILFRAHPRDSAAGASSGIAITYVLLYAEDCGALGHLGDNESFTIFLRPDATGGWQRDGGVAVAHRHMPAERRTSGDGRAIWLSRDKHSPFATFAECQSDEWVPGGCALDGPAPRVALVNAGEPDAPLMDDVGDAWIAAGASATAARGLAPWLSDGVADERALERLSTELHDSRRSPADALNLSYLMVRGRRIWHHEPFLGAGDLTEQLLDQQK